ncbi:hypothetical protein EVAR_95274_1 [Eumeta japonica]|uniref:Uncharacterized protein n=1 Tax=Eumeta variegata TaxID=151549 RepID=A0A4C1ULC0_EUMVA|nr:hypothetical protein EVAR_95274_1 [Eumeta japonica]
MRSKTLAIAEPHSCENNLARYIASPTALSFTLTVRRPSYSTSDDLPEVDGVIIMPAAALKRARLKPLSGNWSARPPASAGPSKTRFAEMNEFTVQSWAWLADDVEEFRNEFLVGTGDF